MALCRAIYKALLVYGIDHKQFRYMEALRGGFRKPRAWRPLRVQAQGLLNPKASKPLGLGLGVEGSGLRFQGSLFRGRF